MDRIATIKRTSEILKTYNIKMKKNFGQNFMIAPKIPELIANNSNIDKHTTVIEIGPGIGALTEFLTEKAKKVVCFEIDKDLIPVLENEIDAKLEIHNQDFLKVDLKEFDEEDKVIVVSNLPYYLTSDILIKILSYPKKIDIIAMMQKEVAKRILSTTSREENELTLYTKYFSKVSKVCEVSKNDFFPRPNVDSTVLYFEKKEVNGDKFVKGIKSLYSQRRKTIYNNLKEFDTSDRPIENVLKELNIEKTKRVEELDFETIIKIIDKVF